MPSCRCQYKVFDITTNRYRLCKNKKKNFDLCTLHLKIECNIYAIKIQSIYRSFYIRKKLKIFYKLPRELQRVIIWNMNKDIYQKHFNSTISKLIILKIKNFYNQYQHILNIYSSHNFEFESNEFLEHLNYIIKIIRKYNCIINFNNNSISNIIYRIKNYMSIIYYNKNFIIINNNIIDNNWYWFINFKYSARLN